MNNNNFKKAIILMLSLLSLSLIIFTQEGRKPWKQVALPVILSIEPDASTPGKIIVSFSFDIGTDGADKATIDMLDSKGKVITAKLMGRSTKDIKTIEFLASDSGTYSFRVTGSRTNESDTKISKIKQYVYSFPILAPSVSARNIGDGKLLVKWEAVHEAESYAVSCKEEKNGKEVSTLEIKDTKCEISGLTVRQKYTITVTAIRGKEKATSPVYGKTVKAEKEREWTFTWFGQSSKADINTIEMIDADNFVFKLNSCSFTADGTTEQKGGKFTAFHDGISYYYTVIDPEKENFELTATFTIDYINPTADGQEGFGLLAMDSLGAHGVNMVNHYTNSAGIIATKYEATIDGVKKTCKDTLGARFVSGITQEVLAMGDSGIAKYGSSIPRAFSYEQSNLIVKGKSYIITLKKSNTGFHAILRSGPEKTPGFKEGDIVGEFIMYDINKLLQLDKDHIYVGFAVARGCNATVSNVSMKITDPKTDPPGQSEPPELVPLEFKVDSPSSYSLSKYPFVFNSNADGRLTVKNKKGGILVENQEIKAFKDFTKEFSLNKGDNEYLVSFTPDKGFKPGPKKALDSYNEASIIHTVTYNTISGKEVFVSNEGLSFPNGKGTKEKPFDLNTAIQYIKPGQVIVLLGGNYKVFRVRIPRGNDGTAAERKFLGAAPGERVILDFSNSTSGMEIWGNYWTIENIEVCNTIGNVKGIQVGGNNNILVNIKTYNCGDTGLQISGTSKETIEKWPKNNLILNCTSYNNCDPAQNNADGFAAKLTSGEGNVFRGCIAYSNIDDGWDLFSKIESGPIGAVLIENCIAYKNGSRLDGSGNGDGNGFKLGGDGITVPHIIRNCIAFNNGTSGITSNSDPAIIVENCTSFGNKQSNIALYGKGSGERLFKAKNNISMKGGSGDLYKEMPELASPNNYFWNGAKSLNSEGKELGADIFVSIDMSIIPGRKSDGSIDMKGLLILNEKAPKGIGANLK